MSSHRGRVGFRAADWPAGLAVFAIAAPAFAQQSGTGSERDQTEIVVTGSRIPRAGFDTLEPAAVISSQYIESRGLTNIADALNETPGFGTGVTPEGNQSSFGPGVSFVNRFGLGSNRTLTLVNGRRVVSSNPANIFGPAASGNQVDLNFVPTVLIDSIDNLAVGGAPTYGADAIAGVVNVRLKQNYEGLQFFGQYGQLEAGGMANNSVGLIGGRNFGGDRGNVTVSLQRSRLDGLLATRVPRFADAYSFATNPVVGVTANQPARRPDNDGRVNPDVPFNTGPSDGIPNAVLIRNRRNATVNFGGVALPLQLPNGLNTLAAPDSRLRCFGATAVDPGTCLHFAADGQLVPYDPGTNFGTTDASGGDGLYLIETAQLMSDLERNSATVNVHFDLSENLRLFGDVFAYKAKALELVDQPAYNSASFGGSSGALTLPAAHPLLTQQARDTLAGLGVQAFRLSRAHRDLAENNARGETDLYQAVVGLEGGFDAAGRRFDWEIYGNFGKRDSVYFSNQLNRQRFVNAINVVSVDGQLQCSATPGYLGLPAAQGGRIQVGADLPVADADCVPLDIFGEARPSAAALEYVSSWQRIDDSSRQRVFNANIGSQLFDIWGGAIAYNVGWESRRESTAFVPDEFLRLGRGRNAAIQTVSGSYHTQEFFGEVIVPLVSERNELPLLRKLTLTGKGRRVDNSVNGEFSAWTGGLQWAPSQDIELRANITRSLRAPSLTELYTPVSPLFTQVNDPCSTQFLSSGTRPDVRAANCAEFFAQYGLPANGSWQSTAVSASVQGSSQGNTALRNESANAWTAGFILRPRWVPNLELAVDWVDIRVEDAITSLTANDLAEACFDNEDFPNHYCGFFTRNAPGAGDPGQVSFVQTGYANGAYQSMAGVTVEGRYRQEFATLGNFELGLSFYRLREELRSATGILRTNSRQQIGSPRNSAQLNLVYEKGPFGARWQTHYVGSQLYNHTFNADSRDILKLNSDYTHNLSMYYDISDRAVMRLAVTNLFDGDPPFPIGGDAFNGNYDFLGRRYSLSVSYEFGGR